MKKPKSLNVTELWESRVLSRGPKTQKPWIYLDREIKQSEKPYNDRVREWLIYLKELKQYHQREAIREERVLERSAGPPWFMEFSDYQREVLDGLKTNIKDDMIQDEPFRVRKALKELGVLVKIPNWLLMKCMKPCMTDPGLFLWDLYCNLYKQRPCDLRSDYDTDACLIMSSLLFLDYNEFIKMATKLIQDRREAKKEVNLPLAKKSKSSVYINDRTKSPYLSRMFAKPYCPKENAIKPAEQPYEYKFNVRSTESYENLMKDTSFLDIRRERNRKEQQKVRICNYPFWEPPAALRYTDPAMLAYVKALRMLKKKAKLKVFSQFKNVQYQLGGVSFVRGKPHYSIQNVVMLQTGYTMLNGGVVIQKITNRTEPVSLVDGFRWSKTFMISRCDKKCNCLTIWEETVMNYIRNSKCKCGHLYDFYNEDELKEIYFRPPTRHHPLFFDEAKIFQFDPTEDFIKDAVSLALRSHDSEPPEEKPQVAASSLKDWQLVSIFLAELSNSHLMIPHLPLANRLRNLQSWVHEVIKGKLTEEEHKTKMLTTLRQWLYLKHMNPRALCHLIPFTEDQLKCLTWDHRKLLQQLYEKVFNNFKLRSTLKLIKQTRYFWGTLDNSSYFSASVLNAFFTYMPNRFADINIVNPLDVTLVDMYGSHTCSLTE